MKSTLINLIFLFYLFITYVFSGVELMKLEIYLPFCMIEILYVLTRAYFHTKMKPGVL